MRCKGCNMGLREWEGDYCDSCNCELQWHSSRHVDDDDCTHDDDEESDV